MNYTEMTKYIYKDLLITHQPTIPEDPICYPGDPNHVHIILSKFFWFQTRITRMSSPKLDRSKQL